MKINILNIISKSLEVKTQLQLLQLDKAMNDVIQHEILLNSEKGFAMNDCVLESNANINKSVFGANQNRDIFHPEIKNTDGYHSYLINNMLANNTVSNENYLRDNDLEVDQESVRELISKLQKLLPENQVVSLDHTQLLNDYVPISDQAENLEVFHPDISKQAFEILNIDKENKLSGIVSDINKLINLLIIEVCKNKETQNDALVSGTFASFNIAFERFKTLKEVLFLYSSNNIEFSEEEKRLIDKIHFDCKNIEEICKSIYQFDINEVVKNKS